MWGWHLETLNPIDICSSTYTFGELLCLAGCVTADQFQGILLRKKFLLFT